MCDINKKYRKKLKDKTEDRNAVIREIQENILKNYLSVNDWYKDSKIKNVIFILSCPGQKEFKDDKSCRGQTGKNLDAFINRLNADFSDVFQDTDRYSYVILNASDKVHFEELTSDSEPNDFEITIKVDNDLKDPNKKGLIQNAKLIFCFGGKAKKYYDKIKEQLDEVKKPIECCHLGTRGLNNCEELKTYLSGRRISEELSNEEKVNYLYELKKGQIEKMVKTLNSSSQEQQS